MLEFIAGIFVGMFILTMAMARFLQHYSKAVTQAAFAEGWLLGARDMAKQIRKRSNVSIEMPSAPTPSSKQN